MDTGLANDLHLLSDTERLDHLAHALGEEAERNVTLARYTTFRVGGPADLLIAAENIDALRRYVMLARQADVPYLILGSGSNVVVADRGFRGLVILNRAKDYQLAFVPNEMGQIDCLIHAESGVMLSPLSKMATRLGLGGLTWAVGIPGTLGGALINNAGAFGGDMAATLQRAEVLDPSGAIVTWTPDQFQFRYRGSRLKADPSGDYVILKATLCLERQAVDALQQQLESYGSQRKRSQPHKPSAGCVFANPPKDYAGRLIDQAGLKGLSVGGAKVSSKHANFVVNTGRATASDILALIHRVQQRVHAQYGIQLELEIQPIGDWPANAPNLKVSED